MRVWKKFLAVAALAPVLATAGYIGYLWITYIDETVSAGTAYGFSIGASKQEALMSANNLNGHPRAVLYVSYGPRAGENFTAVPSASQIDQLQAHDRWDVLLDGSGKFFNSVRLTFRDGKLVEIHRHRKHFELP